MRRYPGIKRATVACGVAVATVAAFVLSPGHAALPRPELADPRPPRPRPGTVFEPNLGQAPSDVLFVARGRGFTATLRAADVVMRLGDRGNRTLRMSLLGADPASAVGVRRLPGTVNYLLGNDPDAWRTGVPTYERVRYQDAYPGIDVVFYGGRTGLELDLIVSPGADPGAVRLGFGGVRPRIAADGSLALGGGLRWLPPIAYQVSQGRGRGVPSAYSLGRDGRVVRFRVGRHDPTRTLVIDPELDHSSYLGAEGADEGHGIAVGADGSIYLHGMTESAGFPILGAYQGTNKGAGDAFVTKLTPDGSALVYATFLGGTGDEKPRAIAVDDTGATYVAGATGSTDFPILNAYRSTNGGDQDVYVAKLDPAGALSFSTYLGGQNGEGRPNLALTGDGLWVSGFTTSHDFPTVAPLQATRAGRHDVFLTRFGLDGSGPSFSTYLGGADYDTARGIAVDASGAVYVAGFTASLDFPITAASQPVIGGALDVFVSKLSPSTGSLVYSTYLGGAMDEMPGYWGNALALDNAGNVYVTGFTMSTNFPTLDALQPAKGSADSVKDAFVTKLGPAGELVFSTFLGGARIDEGTSIALDAVGNIYVSGWTDSAAFPVANPIQGAYGGNTDVFVTKLSPDGGTLVYSTFLGGAGQDLPRVLVATPDGAVHVTGATTGSWPVVSAIQPAYEGGRSDAFVFAIGADLNPPAITSAPPDGSEPDVTFSFEHMDPTVAFECSLDDAAYGPCTSPVAYTGLAEGSHTFRVEVSDTEGRRSPPAVHAWAVGLRAPTLTGVPSDPSGADAAFSFTHDVPGAEFSCSLDGGLWSPCTSPAEYAGLSAGTHTFGVRATVGGTITPAALFDWLVDLAPPTVTMTKPKSEQLLASTRVDVAWSAVDPSGIARTDLYERVGIGGAQALVQSGAALSYRRTGTPGTTYCYLVEAFDAIGNSTTNTERCAAVPYDDRDAAIAWTAPVTPVADGKAYLGTLTMLDAPGEATFTCTCRKVGVMYRKAPISGKMELWVDGALKKTIDTYASRNNNKTYASFTFGLGSHTVRAVWTGTKNASSTGTALYLDGIAAISS